MMRLRDVTKHFNRGGTVIRALDGVSLEIERGEFIAITGASGSGKTTMLQILGCLDVPTSGQYELDGVHVETLGDDALSTIRNQRIGFVFQSFHLVPRLTSRENIETPMLYSDKTPDPARAARLLERVGLSGRADHFPNELSGGEQQRVAIARALVMSPNVLLADEPTGNLDSATGDLILDLLSELHAEGLTIVLVTHDPRIAARAERIVAMKDGRIVDAGMLSTREATP